MKPFNIAEFVDELIFDLQNDIAQNPAVPLSEFDKHYSDLEKYRREIQSVFRYLSNEIIPPGTTPPNCPDQP
jgi:hypothetical protein